MAVASDASRLNKLLANSSLRKFEFWPSLLLCDWVVSNLEELNAGFFFGDERKLKTNIRQLVQKLKRINPPISHPAK
jgi:hypothetical protein